MSLSQISQQHNWIRKQQTHCLGLAAPPPKPLPSSRPIRSERSAPTRSPHCHQNRALKTSSPKTFEKNDLCFDAHMNELQRASMKDFSFMQKAKWCGGAKMKCLELKAEKHESQMQMEAKATKRSGGEEKTWLQQETKSRRWRGRQFHFNECQI